MRAMEDAYFVEEHNSDAAALAFTCFCSKKLLKQCLNIAPLNVRADRVSIDCFERSLMLSLHCPNSTTYWYQ